LPVLNRKNKRFCIKRGEFMRIAIVGAGAMGSFFGARLSRTGSDEVCLIDVWQEHLDEIVNKGLLIKEHESVEIYHDFKTYSASELAGPMDLVIFFVKSILTRKAAEESISLFGGGTLALTLQNGLGNVEALGEILGEENVIAGTTAHGAMLVGPGNIQHTGIGETIIGELNGEITDRILMIQKTFNQAGIETSLSQNVSGLVWDKLLVNVGINALTGITGIKNGELLKCREIEQLLELAVEEGVCIAKAKGITLSSKDPVEHTKEVCRATATNKSSMLQDILKGDKTEIDMMNGAILREGRLLGIGTPINLCLTNLIKFKEEENGH